MAIAALLAGAGVAAAAARSRNHRVFRGHRPALSTAEVKRLAKGAQRPSIIILKNQLSRLPARAATAQARIAATNRAQAPIRAELARVGAKHVRGFHLINAIAASLTTAEANRLRGDAAVKAVVPDTFNSYASLGSGPGPATPDLASTGNQQICPSNPAQPIVEPEAREVMNVDAAEQLADGSGIRVGIVADGIDPNNPDLIRPNGQHVIFDYEDFSGFGTNAPSDGRESFLDAGTIASQANQTYDLSGFVNPAHPLPPGCNIKIKGIAPGASLAVMNLSGPNAGFFNSTIIQGVEWAVLHDHVNILNESIGGNSLPNTENDAVALADQAAVAAGVVVVASSGDAGPFNNIGTPATTPGVISVGGTTTYRVYRQTSRYGTQLSPGGWEDNNITALSSDGINQFNPDTVDVVAPGDRGWSLCSRDTTKFFGCADIDKGANPPPIWAAGGTSASAPETSGTAALVMQAYAKTHRGRLPSPATVQRIIDSTATDLGAPADRQGSGLVNTLKAVQLAMSTDGGSNTGDALEVDQTSLNATVDAGSTHTFTERVTNEGTSPQTVTPSVIGRPTSLATDTGAVTLSAASPTYIDGEGNTDRYAEHQFTVPPGADYLTGDITWNAASSGTAVFETLFDPQGQVAAYSLIGSDHSGFGHVEVRKPNAGVWTAVIFTVNNAAVYNGAVRFQYDSQQFHSSGTVSPASRTLAPGQTGAFNVTVTSGPAGDEGLRLHLGTGGATDGSVPIIIRSLVPLTGAGGTFAGTLTGGGSTGLAGQTFTYQFNVPKNRPALNLALHLADNNYELLSALVDPHGQPVDLQSNTVFDAGDNLLGFGRDMQFFKGTPDPGLWTLVLNVLGPVTGQHLREPFTGTASFTPVPVTSSGVPDSPSAKLTAGQPATATIQVTNTGTQRKDFFADARLNGRVPTVLLGSDTTDVPLPLSLQQQPNWLLPTHADAFGVVAKGNVPIVVEAQYQTGDPDAIGPSVGTTAAALITAPELGAGPYYGLPEPRGPFGPDGVQAGAKADLAGIADINPFDTDVTASSGDAWQQSVDPTAPYTPLNLAPGQTGTITLTFTPSGRKGQVVRGFIDVDTLNLFTLSGDEVTSIPYSYRVK